MTKRGRKKKTGEEVIEEKIITEFDNPLMEVFPVEEIKSPSLPEPPKTKKIKYLGVPDIFIIRGSITGQRYQFAAKDRISEVAIEDYEGLLQRVRPARKCCGGKMIPEQPYFGPV